jgi:DNA-binding transcriptional LysR family regulator
MGPADAGFAQWPARFRCRRATFELYRAAAELNVTQTAISHQIRRLEEQLGIPLFVRRNRALLLAREARGYQDTGPASTPL